jgi:Protein of unknown function (DUF1571)
MKTATDSGVHVASLGHMLPLIPALTLFSIASGCAGWSSVGENRTGLSGAFWNRSDKTTKTAAYDFYADAGAAARPQAAEDTQLASEETKKDRSSATTEKPAPDLIAQEEANRSEGAAVRRKRAKTADTSIRVTLGRPESLPALGDPAEVVRPLLASAASTHWKRGSSVVGSETAQQPERSRTRESDRQNLTDDQVGQQRASSREEKLQDLLATTRERIDALSTYQVDIARIERVGGQMQSEEEVVLSIRRNPKAVRLEWAKGPNKGREVIYSTAINDRMMYVNSGNSALPLPRMSIPVDSPLAMRNSRHPITEAGFDTILENLFKFLEPKAVAAASDGKLVYKGIDQPRGLDQPCHLVMRVTPKGETWQVYLDTRTYMPAMVSAVQTSSGQLIERYTYRNLRLNPVELAALDAFDPDKRWGESKGWLSRIARVAGTPTDSNSRQTTTR